MIKITTLIIKHNPENKPYALMDCGAFHEAMGDLDQALRDYEEILALERS